MKKIFLSGAMVFLAVLEFAGCKSNPYPDGQYTAQRPVAQYTVSNCFIDAPSKVVFSEGTRGSFTIHGMGSTSGDGKLTLTGLPSGAVYSDADQSVTWTPDYNAGNDPNNNSASYMSYDLVASYSCDSKTVAEKTIILNVNDTPRPYKVVNFETTPYMTEGLPYNFPLEIDDFDSPKGPFTIAQANAPDGIVFTPDPTAPNKYSINFMPPYDMVDSVYTSTQTGTKDFNWTLLVSDPRGKVISVPVSWHISDSRLDPVYVGPAEFSVKSTELDFIFQAQDPNLEVAPVVTLDSTNSGTVELTALSPTKIVKGQQPSQAFHVHWSNIPLSNAGKSEILRFHLCVYGVTHSLDQCYSQPVTVNFTFAAPIPTPQPTSTQTPNPTPTSLTLNGGRQ